MSEREADTHSIVSSENPHNHTDAIESSRSRSAGSGAQSLGPVRTGRETPSDYRPGSQGSMDDGPVELSQRSPLPPISSPSGLDIPLQPVTSEIISKSMAVQQKGHGSRMPRVMSYRRETDTEEVVRKTPESEAQRAVSFETVKPPPISQREELKMEQHDGTEKTLISIDCQTEWSWLDEQKTLQSRRPSVTSQGQQSARSSAKSQILTNSAKTKTPQSRSDHAKSRQSIVADPVQPPGLAPDDTYGIPLLQISSDSDYNRESERADAIPEDDEEDGTARLVSEEDLKKLKEVEDLVGTSFFFEGDIYGMVGVKTDKDKWDYGLIQGGMLEGTCEFCSQPIKPFPSLQQQKNTPPDQLYCCDEYHQFVKFMVTHPLHDKYNVDKPIDIAPHPPYGSKQARRAAKERAAQRMRERELARQQAALAGMSGGGGGGGGGPSNFYQFARQMKTINYQLSSQKCLEEGWTMRPPTPLNDLDGEPEVFEPQPNLPMWANPKSKTYRGDGFIVKYYDDGKKFLNMFQDGTGNVLYPSGRTAIAITSVEKGLYTHVALDDDEEHQQVLAVFHHDGSGASYYSHGSIRICLDQLGGMELDAHGSRKRRWSWKDQVQHVHAPPIQPITFSITPHLSLRIISQDQILLQFTLKQRSARFQVGTRLKLVAKDHLLLPDVEEDDLVRERLVGRIQSLFMKVTNLLKFPKSPKLDKLPNPPHIGTRANKMERKKEIRTSLVKEKEKTMPTIVVN